MKPKIALISNILNPVRPDFPGGIEVLNYYLTKELSKRGWPVKLYASGDSTKLPELESIVPKSLAYAQTEEYLKIPWNYRRITVAEFAIYAKLVDDLAKEQTILHFSAVNFLPVYLAAQRGLPTVTTLHMPADNLHYQSLLKLLSPKQLRNVNFIGISKNQVKKFPHINRVIYNGINLDDLTFNPKGKSQYVWLGRMIKEKGGSEAAQLAHQAGVELDLAGRVTNEAEKDYFDKKIKPHLSTKIDYNGQIGRDEKARFYAGKAFLFPLQWPEPFGLVMIEAMACGTPVIAYDLGAVSEIVKDGVTGFICKPNDKKAFLEAIKTIEAMSPERYQEMRQACRQHVEDNFSVARMTEQYEEVYQKVARQY